MYACRRVAFYQFENSALADGQVHCERIYHPDDHTDMVLTSLLISRFSCLATSGSFLETSGILSVSQSFVISGW